MLIFAEEHPVTEEMQIKEESQKMEQQDKISNKTEPEIPLIDELEITIKPKVDDTFRNECIRPPVSVKYGISPNWELFLRLNTFLNNPLKGENRNGMSDVSIGTKYHCKKLFKPYMDATAAFSVQIPTGNNEDISDGYTHYLPQLIFTKTLSDWHQVKLAATIKMDILSGSPDNMEALDQKPKDNSLTVILGFLYPDKPFQYSIETEWTTTEIDGGHQNSVYLISGIFWNMPKAKYQWIPGTIRLGGGLRIGLTAMDT
jgi:hypothetical protein